MPTFKIPESLEGPDLDYFIQKRCSTLIGIDEVGRGALAGPVVTCALSLKDSGISLRGLNDSKKLSLAQRLSLFSEILPHIQFIGLGVAFSTEIDQINIYQATKVAMLRAIEQLQSSIPSPLPSAVLLIDGLFIPHPHWESFKLIKGDTRSPHIMAASIIAKVTRDSLMSLYHKEFPQFYFDKNQGYGTAHHRTILQKQYTYIHRKTFAPLKDLLDSSDL